MDDVCFLHHTISLSTPGIFNCQLVASNKGCISCDNGKDTRVSVWHNCDPLGGRGGERGRICKWSPQAGHSVYTEQQGYREEERGYKRKSISEQEAAWEEMGLDQREEHN